MAGCNSTESLTTEMFTGLVWDNIMSRKRDHDTVFRNLVLLHVGKASTKASCRTRSSHNDSRKTGDMASLSSSELMFMMTVPLPPSLASLRIRPQCRLRGFPSSLPVLSVSSWSVLICIRKHLSSKSGHVKKKTISILIKAERVTWLCS